MRRSSLLIVVAIVVAFAAARPAAAVLQFYKEFETLYIKDHPNKDFVKEVTTGTNKCLICHQGKNRKNHNAFGIHLVEPLDRKKDLKDKEKIIAEIEKVVQLHVDPKDDKSETYLDRIKAGKWPGGELEELKKEPPKSDTAK
jgi:hypothetical protein